MMNAIAPVWDGNETWLVLGGGGLLAAFPLAYSVVMPALYLPIILMLLALILRGVAFEFRLRGRRRGKHIWTVAFAGGSLTAAFAQGLVLGGFIQGVTVTRRRLRRRRLRLADPYTLLVACGLTCGLRPARRRLADVQDRGRAARRRPPLGRHRRRPDGPVPGRRSARPPCSLHPAVAERWGVSLAGRRLGTLRRRWPPSRSWDSLGLAIVAAGCAAARTAGLSSARRWSSCRAMSAWRWASRPTWSPTPSTYVQAAAADNALALMLVGVGILLPVILGYTVWVYWVFRGKVGRRRGLPLMDGEAPGPLWKRLAWFFGIAVASSLATAVVAYGLRALLGDRSSDAVPLAHPAHVDVDEVGHRIEADAAALEAQSRLADVVQRHPVEADVQGLAFHVQAVGGDAAAAVFFSMVLVLGER